MRSVRNLFIQLIVIVPSLGANDDSSCEDVIIKIATLMDANYAEEISRSREMLKQVEVPWLDSRFVPLINVNSVADEGQLQSTPTQIAKAIQCCGLSIVETRNLILDLSKIHGKQFPLAEFFKIALATAADRGSWTCKSDCLTTAFNHASISYGLVLRKMAKAQSGKKKDVFDHFFEKTDGSVNWGDTLVIWEKNRKDVLHVVVVVLGNGLVLHKFKENARIEPLTVAMNHYVEGPSTPARKSDGSVDFEIRRFSTKNFRELLNTFDPSERPRGFLF